MFCPYYSLFFLGKRKMVILPAFLAKGLDQLDGVIACNLTSKACVTVNTGQSFIVPLVWALVLGGISTYLFIKRDVMQ
jgi:hypothetical protein